MKKAGSIIKTMLPSLLPYILIAGVVYFVYNKIFGKTPEEKAVEAEARAQQRVSKEQAEEITNRVIKNTTGVISSEEALNIANTVHYYANSFLFTQNDQDAIRSVLNGLTSASLRSVSQAWGMRKMERRSGWFFLDNETYNLHQALVYAFGQQQFDVNFGNAFKLAAL